jgi:hypothetical protein
MEGMKWKIWKMKGENGVNNMNEGLMGPLAGIGIGRGERCEKCGIVWLNHNGKEEELS